jgi:hypothetical protein
MDGLDTDLWVNRDFVTSLELRSGLIKLTRTRFQTPIESYLSSRGGSWELITGLLDRSISNTT